MNFWFYFSLMSGALNAIVIAEIYRHDERKTSKRLKRQIEEYKTTIHGLVDQLMIAKKALRLVVEVNPESSGAARYALLKLQ